MFTKEKMVEIFTGRSAEDCNHMYLALGLDWDNVQTFSISELFKLSYTLRKTVDDDLFKMRLVNVIVNQSDRLSSHPKMKINVFNAILHILYYKSHAEPLYIIKSIKKYKGEGNLGLGHYEPPPIKIPLGENMHSENVGTVAPEVLKILEDKMERTNKARVPEMYTDANKIGDNNMQIKKVDELTIEEFKKTEEAYDKVFVVFNKEKCDKIIKDYGTSVTEIRSTEIKGEKVYGRYLDGTIEFYPKAIANYGDTNTVSSIIPYYIVDKVICTYYIVR